MEGEWGEAVQDGTLTMEAAWLHNWAGPAFVDPTFFRYIELPKLPG